MADVTVDTVAVEVEANAREANESLKVLESRLNSLGRAFSAIKFGVVIKGLEQIGKVGFKAMSAMGDYIETLNLFRSTMGASTQAAEKFIDKAEKVLGLDPGMMMNSVAMLQTLAEGFGLSNDEAYLMSKNLTQLAADMSSFMNISFESALTKIKSGFSGEVRAMRSMGVALDRATLQQTMYKLGIDQTYASLTRAQKTELIYYQMMTSTTKMQGDLARTLISPQNALRILGQEFAMAGRAIGSIFIPLALKVIPIVRAVTQIIKEAAQSLASLFGFKIADYESDISDIGSLLGGVSDDIDGVGSSAGKAAKELQKMLMPFDELNNISLEKPSASSAGGTGTGGIGGGGSLGIQLPEYDMFTNALTTNVEKIKEQIKSFLPIITAVGAAVTTVWLAWKGLKIAGSITNLIKSLKTGTTYTRGFTDVISALVGGGKKAKIGFKDLAFAVGRVAVGIAGLGIGIIGIIDNWKLMDTAVRKGEMDWKKFALTLGETTVGFGLLGLAIGGPVGAALGAAAGLLAGVVTQLIAMKKVQKEVTLNNFYGNLTISTDEWTNALRDNNSELTAYMQGFTQYKEGISEFSTGFNNAATSMRNYISKFSTGVFQITDVDFEKIKSANEELGDNAVAVVQNSTERSIEVLSDYYRKNDGIIDESERANLQKIKENGEKEIAEINYIKARDAEIIQNAANERRGFTEEEARELDEHYKRLTEITEKHLGTLEGKIQLYQQKILDSQKSNDSDRLNLSRESYQNLAQAIDEYTEEAEKAMEAHYVELYNALLDNNWTEEQARNEAYRIYLEEEKETNAKIEEMRDTVTADLIDSYHEMENQNTESAKIIRDDLENVLKDFKFKDEDFKTASKLTAEQSGMLFHQKFTMYGKTSTGDLIEFNSTDVIAKGERTGWDLIRGIERYQISTGEMIEVDYNQMERIGLSMARSIQRGINYFGNFSFGINAGHGGNYGGGRAEGGFVDTGEFFLAREAGPELVGKIGNKTAVANNDQITQGIAAATYNAFVRAMSEIGGAGNQPVPVVVNVGNRKIYEGYAEYKDEMNQMYGVNIG